MQNFDASTASDASDAYLERQTSDNRLIEIFAPLMKVTDRMPQQEKIIEAFLTIAKVRETEEQLSLEASIIEAISRSKEKLDNGKVSVSIITDVFNADRPEKEKWRSDSVGRQVKKLGFESCRTSDGKRGIFWNEPLFLKLQ